MSPLLPTPSFELIWEARQGAFHLESPGRLLIAMPGLEVVLPGRARARTLVGSELSAGREEHAAVEDVHGHAQELRVHFQEVLGLALTLQLRLYRARPFVMLRLTLTNVGREPVRVRRFFVRSSPGGLQSLGEPTGCYVTGWQSWSPAGFVPRGGVNFRPPRLVRHFQGPLIHNARTPWTRRVDRFWSESVGALVTTQEALVAGGVSLADQFVQFWADLRPGHETVMVQSQADDVAVSSGASLSSEWFYLEWVPLPNVDPLAQYAHAVVRQMEVPPARVAPTGWCSWCVYEDQVSETDIMENIASAALLADEIPLDVIQLDDGYQEMWGDWSVRNSRFSHDMRWLADRIRGSHLVPGLWLAPLTAHPQSRLAREHPDWLLHKRSGRLRSAGLVSNFMGRALDPTHPEVEEHLRELIATVVGEWGYRYLKLDYLYAGALPGRRYNTNLTRAQALRHALHVIRESAGSATYLVGCGCPLGPALGLVDAMRIGPDTATEWAPHYKWGGRLMRRNPSLPSLRNSLRNVATRAWMHNRWWINDPDVLLARAEATALTPDEVQAQVTLMGLSGGLLLLSDDLEDLQPERRAMVAKLFPPLLDGMDVLDLFSSRMPEAVVVPVARPWGHWRLVGLFNWSDMEEERTLPDSLALSTRRPYHIVDFWQQRYIYLEPDALPPVVHLPPHGAALLGVRLVSEELPQLVGTTFHISQGAEVTEWLPDEDSLTLTLALGRVVKGAVWLALPRRPRAVYLNDEHLPTKAVRAIGAGVWAIESYVNRTATFDISL